MVLMPDDVTCSSSGTINIGILRDIVAKCEVSANYKPLLIFVRSLFSDKNVLKNSFLMDKNDYKKLTSGLVEELDTGFHLLHIRKEGMRDGKCGPDQDNDCREESMQLCDDKQMSEMEIQPDNDGKKEQNIDLDIWGVQQAYDILFRCPASEVRFTLMDSWRHLLRDSMGTKLMYTPLIYEDDRRMASIFIILLENPILLDNPDLARQNYSDLAELCEYVGDLCLKHQATLVRHLATWGQQKLQQFLQSVHQLIANILSSAKVISNHDDKTIIMATKTMNIVYNASIYGGKWGEPLLLQNTEPYGRPPFWDPLAKLLGIHPFDAKEPLVPLKEFHNEYLSNKLEVDKDFAYSKTYTGAKFSFGNFPFILTTTTKCIWLYYDSKARMHSQRRMSIRQSDIDGRVRSPYLIISIRRECVIEDALAELNAISIDSPIDLKKQLMVKFIGEEGIDEGGVSKDFFQLIIGKLFNPDYGMFELNKESQKFWFNHLSFKNDAQFSLVGIILGLAIYNNIILDLHFPNVIYKKLCGKPGSFHDLQECKETIYNSLLYILEYEDDDMEDVFCQSFSVDYEGLFGVLSNYELIPDGGNIIVNQGNKVDFVNVYTDFLLNKSVERQFGAFKKGFIFVTDDSPITQLFRPEELEVLVCGSKHYDFLELERSSEYDNGYTNTTPIIIWFWEMIDEWPSEYQKLLLQFITGSARAPVGGLSRLKITISRHGRDTDRLPTAHTCFNVLLLPEYSSKEKLKERLLKAITYTEGFGMM